MVRFRCRKHNKPNWAGGWPVSIKIEPNPSRGNSCALSWIDAAHSDARSLYASLRELNLWTLKIGTRPGIPALGRIFARKFEEV